MGAGLFSELSWKERWCCKELITTLFMQWPGICEGGILHISMVVSATGLILSVNFAVVVTYVYL